MKKIAPWRIERKYIMSEENKNENEMENSGANETPEVNEEAVENVNAADEQAAEPAAEETSQESSEPVQAEEAETTSENTVPGIDFDATEGFTGEIAKKKSHLKTIIIIAAAVVVVAVAAIVFAFNMDNWFNPYTKDYVDVDGITIGEVADMNGMELSEFLEYYDLPEDMPASTPEKAAFYTIPAGKYAEMYGMTFEDLATQLGWDSTITEETTIGDALDKTTLGMYVGEENLESFKQEYGLDDSVTADTLWGEVRNIVDTRIKEDYEASQAETEEPADEATEAAEESSEDTAAQATESADTAATAAAE